MFLKNKISQWLKKTFRKPTDSYFFEFLLLVFAILGLSHIMPFFLGEGFQAFFKLLIYFLSLTGASFLIFQLNGKRGKTKKQDLLFESLLIFLILLFILGIEMISQKYHITGTFYQSHWFLSLLTCGFMLFSRSGWVIYSWLFIFCIGFLEWQEFNLIPLSAKRFYLLFFVLISLVLQNKKLLKTWPQIIYKKKCLEKWTILLGTFSFYFFYMEHIPIEKLFLEISFISLISIALLIGFIFSDHKKKIKALLSLFLGGWVLFYLIYLYIPSQIIWIIFFLIYIIFISLVFFFIFFKQNRLFKTFILSAIVYSIVIPSFNLFLIGGFKFKEFLDVYSDLAIMPYFSFLINFPFLIIKGLIDTTAHKLPDVLFLILIIMQVISLTVLIKNNKDVLKQYIKKQ